MLTLDWARLPIYPLCCVWLPVRYWTKHKKACVLFYTARFFFLTRLSHFDIIGWNKENNPHAFNQVAWFWFSSHSEPTDLKSHVSFLSNTHYGLFCRKLSCIFLALWRSNLCLFFFYRCPSPGGRMTSNSELPKQTGYFTSAEEHKNTIDSRWALLWGSCLTDILSALIFLILMFVLCPFLCLSFLFHSSENPFIVFNITIICLSSLEKDHIWEKYDNDEKDWEPKTKQLRPV